MGLDRLGALLRDPRAKVSLVVVVFVGGILASMAAGQSDVVLKGVAVGGIPVAGLDAEELVSRLRTPAQAIEARRLTLRAGERSWATTPVAAGIRVDVAATAEQALRAGRENPFRWLRRTVGGGPVELGWVPAVDAPALDARIRRLAEDVRRDAADGEVAFRGPRVVVTPPSEGMVLVEDRAREALVAAAMRPPAEDQIELPVEVTRPAIDAVDVEAVRTRAQTLLAAPVEFRVRGRVAILAPERVAAALRVEAAPVKERRGSPEDQELALRVDEDALRAQLLAIAPDVESPPRDASFTVDGDRVRLVASSEGWTVDTRVAAEALLGLSRGAPRVAVDLPQRPLAPTLTTEAARQLGIVQRIASYRTTFDATNAPRVGNIGRMAASVHGRVLRPGETFSLNDATGPRTPANGYQEAGVIVDGELVPGIGGGVCQVGTTLFNAVAEAGLQVTTRYNHSLYIAHYPMGRDATVNYGRQDLVFRNDTPYGVLLRAVVDARALTVSIFSSPLGRAVVWEQSPQSNPREPVVKYVDDPALPTGVEQVVEEGKPGFDITTVRRVTEGGRVVHEDRFVSRYRAWKRIVRRGTGPAVTPSPVPPATPSPVPSPSPGTTPAPSPVPEAAA